MLAATVKRDTSCNRRGFGAALVTSFGALFAAICIASSAVHAQDGLVSTWVHLIAEGDGSNRLAVKEDGTAELTIEAHFGPDFVSVSLANGELAELPDTPFFTEGFRVRFVMTGRWEVTGTQFSLSATDFSVSYSGLNEENFWAALEREVVELPGLGQGPHVNVRINLEEFFETTLNFIEGTEFSLDGDTLVLMDEDGFETVYRRLNPVTVVAARSWGQVKAAY